MTEEKIKTELTIKISFTTLLSVVASVIAIGLIVRVTPLLFPLFFGVLLAVSLTPLVQRLQRFRCPRGLAISVVTVFLAAIIFIAVAMVMPPLVRESRSFIENIPQLRQKIAAAVPDSIPGKGTLLNSVNDMNLTSGLASLQQILDAGQIIVGGFVEILLFFVFTVYLLIDGHRCISWISAFFSPTTQRKIETTRLEVGKIISAYIKGQFITSILSFAFVFTVMTLLGVPNALLPAGLAFIFDILPVLGFFLTLIFSMLFALNVSTEASLMVLGFLLCFHALENYFISPLVYGNTLRLSSFVVFFSLLAGGLIGGIDGAIAVLPIVASYPIIEKIWLRPYIPKHTVRNHGMAPLSKAKG